MNNNYLIPANSKKSMLILGLFNQLDLIIFGVGVGITLLGLTFVNLNSLINIILVLLPGLTATMLVFPVPNYHNVMTFLISMYRFFSERQVYIWKGWCFNNGSDEK